MVCDTHEQPPHFGLNLRSARWELDYQEENAQGEENGTKRIKAMVFWSCFCLFVVVVVVAAAVFAFVFVFFFKPELGNWTQITFSIFEKLT